MKVTCSYCSGKGCPECGNTGHRESRPRHTSLTLACCANDEDQVRFYEDTQKIGLLVTVENKRPETGKMVACDVWLDAAAEASLLKFLKAREEERHG